MCKYGNFSSPLFPAFGLNSEKNLHFCVQSKNEKHRPEKASHLHT